MTIFEEYNIVQHIKHTKHCPGRKCSLQIFDCSSCERDSSILDIRFLSNFFYTKKLSSKIKYEHVYKPTEADLLYLAINYPNLYRLYKKETANVSNKRV